MKITIIINLVYRIFYLYWILYDIVTCHIHWISCIFYKCIKNPQPGRMNKTFAQQKEKKKEKGENDRDRVTRVY